MPKVPTPAELRAAAAEARAEGLGLVAYADELDALAAKRELTMREKRSMVSSNMEAPSLAGKPENVRTSANRARRSSAARDAMIASNHVAADLAKSCRVGRSTMNAYLNGTRAVPGVVRERLAHAPYLIPADSWPRIA